MLTKILELGVLEILPDGVIQVREDTVIYEDGKEISRTYMRSVLNPGDDVSNKPAPIPAIAALLWTDEVIAAYKEKLIASNPFKVS